MQEIKAEETEVFSLGLVKNDENVPSVLSPRNNQMFVLFSLLYRNIIANITLYKRAVKIYLFDYLVMDLKYHGCMANSVDFMVLHYLFRLVCSSEL